MFYLRSVCRVIGMLNMKMTPPSSVAQSSRADILERVIGIARAPLIPGEAQKDYVALAARIVASAPPRDAIEEVLTRDVVDLTWETLRLRRVKAALSRANVGNGVEKILETIGYGEYALDTSQLPSSFAAEWSSGKASTRKRFSQMLKKAGLTMAEVEAEAFVMRIEPKFGSWL